jgi:hypothetical protein
MRSRIDMMYMFLDISASFPVLAFAALPEEANLFA